MRFGAHLPLVDFGDQRYAVDHVVDYVENAVALGFDAITTNDHFVFDAPWLDGSTALAVPGQTSVARLVS
jgi:alkanesulfonate monooxygenase SsuD/methylene tetrahydromethanopterin reductase-like flavin-dependent oxidoreductase (luciferase family)